MRLKTMMRWSGRALKVLALVNGLIAGVAGAQAHGEKIFAAGSLKNIFEELSVEFAKEMPGFHPDFTFGPSGKLREMIEQGANPSLFASASPEHTDRLVKNGKLRSHVLFARNSLCVAARSGLTVTTDTVVNTLLDDNVVVGTSTPGADPSGDYTWEMFKRIDRIIRPGSFEVLDKKAQKLTGASVNPADSRPAYARILNDKRADVFVTYCTNAAEAARESPGITFARIPTNIDVASDYSVGLSMDASERTRLFVRFIMGPRGQQLLAARGFGKVPQVCEDLPALVKNAHAAWTAPASRLQMSAEKIADAPIPIGTRANVTLYPAAQLQFARREEGTRNGFGGSARFRVVRDGHYEVFSSVRGWLDIASLKSGEVINSIRSDRWLGCAGVNKNLGFMLKAGEEYQLQISEVNHNEIGLLIDFIKSAP